MDAKVVTVRPDEAADMIASGEAVLLDVRPKELYEKAHPKVGCGSFGVLLSFLAISLLGLCCWMCGHRTCVQRRTPRRPCA